MQAGLSDLSLQAIIMADITMANELPGVAPTMARGGTVSEFR
jgi:hypothetical protein